MTVINTTIAKTSSHIQDSSVLRSIICSMRALVCQCRNKYCSSAFQEGSEMCNLNGLKIPNIPAINRVPMPDMIIHARL